MPVIQATPRSSNSIRVETTAAIRRCLSSQPSELDFVHLSQFASQLIGSETHVLFRLKGWPCSPCRSPSAVSLSLCPRLFQTGLATRESPYDRCRPGSGETNSDGDSPTYGTQCSARLSDVSSCPASRGLVASQSQSAAAQALGAVFIPRGVVVLGLEDTIERRRGEPITATGISRYPGALLPRACCHSQWPALACMSVLPPLSWADRVWAWPLLTVLCPSERVYAQRGRGHQTLTERAWQRIRRGALVAGTCGRLGRRQPCCRLGAAGQGRDLAPCQCDHAAAS